MDKLYQRINYENSPSKKTPLSEANLNKMDKALDDLDNRIIEQDAAFAKSIEEEDKKIEEVNGKVSALTDTAATLTQSKADAIVCSASGERITATDSADAGFEQFRTFGKSVQETTSGKNLLETDGLNYTSSGITRTKNADGSVTFNGTATADAFFTECEEFTFEAEEKYILSGCPDGGSSSKYFLYADGVSGIDYGESAEIICDTDTTTTIVIAFRSGVTVSNLTFKPMIRYADVEDDTYEPYTGAIPSPNPEYPQPIVSAGQSLGNQLYNNETSVQYSLDDSGTLTANDARILSDFIKVSTVEYRLEFPSDVLFIGYGMYDSSKNFVSRVMFNYSTGVATFTPTQNGYIRLMFRNTEGTSVDLSITDDVMFSTDLMVYDVGISKKLTGKNLLDMANIVEHAETAKKFLVGLLPAGTYTFSCKNAIQKRVRIIYTDESYTDVIYWKADTNCTFTVEKAFYGVQVNTESKSIDFSEWYCQLEYGAEATDYEPYTEQTLTLDRVLRGIPVTDASLATYTDENGQMWCADEIDVERGVLVQRVTEYVLDGNENWMANPIATGVYRARLYSSTACNISPMLCDSYAYKTANETYLGQEGIGIDGDRCICIYDENYNTSDISLWTAHLAENPIKVQYILATPIETPLTDVEIAAYKALHTNKPTTVITNDAGCYMEVEYVADTKNHIAQNYVPVTAFNDVLDRISALEQLHV